MPVDARFALIVVDTLEANCLEVYRRGRRYQKVVITRMARVIRNELLLFEVSVYRGQTISPPLRKRKSNVNVGTNITSDTPLKLRPEVIKIKVRGNALCNNKEETSPLTYKYRPLN